MSEGEFAGRPDEETGRPDSRAVAVLNRLTLGVCEIILVVMMVLIVAEVVMRSGFGRSLHFVDEYAAYTLVWLTFLGISVSLHDGAVFRVGLFYDMFPEPLRVVLQVLWDVLALASVSVLTWHAARHVTSSFERGMEAPTVMQTPLWLPQFAMPLGGALAAIVLLAILVNDLKRLARGPR